MRNNLDFRLQIQRNMPLYIQLISQILNAFNENKYTLVILIDLSQEFAIVDHDILLK